jgi:calcium permeable stress-gated cation channel
MRHFITVRQLHLINPAHSKSVQANTILVTGIPARYLSVAALSELYSHLPGGIVKVWLNRCVPLFACVPFIVPVPSVSRGVPAQ